MGPLLPGQNQCLVAGVAAKKLERSLGGRFLLRWLESEVVE